ncbi:MAG: hypothetical protein SGBAC_006646 [Bacillariaceae sp.]
MGRRMELRVAASLYIVGTLINVASGTLLQSNDAGLYALFFGRILFGIGVGFVMHGAPAYLAEMCPPHIRGAVVSAKETVIVSGIVVGYVVGNWRSKNNPLGSWVEIYALQILLQVPLWLLTIFYIPRSKRWLLLHGHREEAEESMRFIYVNHNHNSNKQNDENDDIHLAFLELAKQVEETKTAGSSLTNEESSSISHLLFSSKEYRPALLASMGLIVFQQISGQPTLLSYTTILFDAGGWGGDASVFVSLLMMAMSTSTVLFVDHVGRKPLLKLCCGVMLSASILLGICFYNMNDIENNDNNEELSSSTRLVVLIGACLYIGGYQIGFGPVTWCIVSEVFPLEIRGKAIAVGVELNYLLSFLVSFLLPMVQVSVGWSTCFGVFGCMLVIAYWFVDQCVPETRGLTLEEIQRKLSAAGTGGGNHSRASEDQSEDNSPSETTRLISR